MSGSIVELDSVSFRYPGRREVALSDVSLRLEGPTFVGLVGPNGGGKTTLLKLLLGLETPDRGSVRVLGDLPHLARRRVGYVPQHAEIDPGAPATVSDIVLTGRLARGSWGPRYRSEDHEQARSALERTEAVEFSDLPWGALSGGQRQRVLIARALAGDAELLLLDEPTTGIDLHRERSLLALLDRLRETLPIVMVSHDPALVASHMDTALFVNRRVTAMPADELTVAAIERLFHDEEVGHGHDHGRSEPPT